MDELIAIRTRLGWLICGNSNVKKSNKFEFNFHICECDRLNDSNLSDLIKKIYSLEMAGISKDQILGKDDQRAINYLEKYTKQLENGHYETALRWQ